jgi:hypothetical protein
VERDAENIRVANAFITPASLRSERIQISQRLEPAQYWVIQQLHRLIRLGIGEAAEQEKRNAAKTVFNDACHVEREELVAKATLSAEEFLIGEKVGTAVIHWVPGPFEWRRFDSTKKATAVIRVWHLFALFERNEQGRVKVAECPQRLVEFFAGYRDFESPGEQYSELGRIGVLLRQAKRNLIRAAERAAVGGDTNGAEEAAESTE